VQLTGRVFLVLLALCWACAWASLEVQVVGLFGAHGLVPATATVAAVRHALAGAPSIRFPTLFWWIPPTDAVLVAACAVGVLLAVAVAAGVAPRAALLASWVLYLSVLAVGEPFLSFQWDALLCETTLIAIFLAPPGLRPFAGARPRAIGAAPVWLERWLLFRLMFLSGVVKLLAEPPGMPGPRPWHDLTALVFHWWTQPLPTPLAWWAAQLPMAFQRAACAAMFAIELVAPWTLFLWRPVRRAGVAALVLLQVLIALTGNYGFFNLLTLTLCVLGLDDQLLARVPLVRRLAPRDALLSPAPWRRAAFAPLAAALVLLSLVPTLARVGMARLLPGGLVAAWRTVAPLESVNAYGLFATMTTERDEVILEGSDDGTTWREYGFRWKPGNPDRSRPGWVAPHMPRLDWQMWFAALSRWEREPWLDVLMRRLLAGEPTVLALLGENPFPDHPPRLVRATRWRYRFATPEERAATGRTWERTLVGPYGPVHGGS
jgi:hypothetical protein